MLKLPHAGKTKKTGKKTEPSYVYHRSAETVSHCSEMVGRWPRVILTDLVWSCVLLELKCFVTSAVSSLSAFCCVAMYANLFSCYY